MNVLTYTEVSQVQILHTTWASVRIARQYMITVLVATILTHPIFRDLPSRYKVYSKRGELTEESNQRKC